MNVGIPNSLSPHCTPYCSGAERIVKKGEKSGVAEGVQPHLLAVDKLSGLPGWTIRVVERIIAGRVDSSALGVRSTRGDCNPQ
jgi:hypothetical protein